MSRNEQFDPLLDQALDEIRDTEIDTAAESASYQRVWSEIEREATRASLEAEQNQTDDSGVPSIQGAHADAKRWLYEDAQSDTLQRGRKLQAQQSVGGKKSAGSGGWLSTWGPRVAAAAAMFIIVIGVSVNTDVLKIKTSGLITIESVEGTVAKQSADGTVTPLAAGATYTLEDGDAIRTGRDGQVMLSLNDQSRVEIAPRSDVGLEYSRNFWQRKSDAVIGLDRGNIIVEASKQGSGHLYVDTPDAMVAVTGTVFAVNSGMKGSRVSVIEGSVDVDQDSGRDDTLTPGQQVTTSAALGHVDIAEEISWSQNAEQHLAMLREVFEIANELDKVLAVDQRTSTDLLESMPADTAFYFGAPNLARSADEAYDVFEQKLATTTELKSWWEQNVTNEEQSHLRSIMQGVANLGDQLGDEVVFGLLFDDMGGDNDLESFVFMSELNRPDGFREYVESQVAELAALAGADEDDVDLDDAFIWLDGIAPDVAVGDTKDKFILWVREDRLVGASDIEGIMAIRDHLDGGQRVASPFHEELAEVYRYGTEWILGVDLGRLMNAADAEENRELDVLGFNDMRYVIGEQETVNGFTEARVNLDFDRERRGLASWIDSPSALGSMDYIGADAVFATGIALKEPAVMMDELFSMIDALGDGESLDSKMAEFEAENGFNLRDDFAALLGGEFAFSVEKPLIPKPNLKLIVEVYDPSAFQHTMQRLVDRLNDVARESDVDAINQGLVTLSEQSEGDRTYHALTNPATELSVWYTFDNGYMVAGSSKVQLDNAIKTRNMDLGLGKSRKFRSLLPTDRQNNVSLVVYHDMGASLSQIAGIANRLAGDGIVNADFSSGPSLTVGYAEAREISVAYRREGGLFGGTIGGLMNIQSLLNLDRWRGAGVQSGNRTEPEAAAIRIASRDAQNTGVVVQQ